MRRIALFALLAGLVIGSAACKKDGSGGGGGGKGKTVGAATSALDVLPEDTAMVIGVNIEKVTSSKLWATYSPLFMNEGEVKDGLAKLKDGCGLDALKDVKSFVVGMNGDMDEKKMVMLIQGNYDEGKITKCVTALAEKEAGKKITAKTEGKITTFTAEGESKTIAIGWAAKDTIVITQDAVEGDKTFLASVLEGKTSAKNNKDLSSLMGNVDTSSTLWLAMVVTGKLKSQMASAEEGPQPVALWVNLDYTKALKLDIGARFANDKDASAAVEKANKELETVKSDPQAGPYLKTLKIEAKGNDALVSLSLDEKQVDELVAKLQEVLPMLMMMGMGGMGGGM